MEKRRDFIKKVAAGSAGLTIGGVALGFSAKSYKNVQGANDRIRMGIIGVNSRGNGMGKTFARAKNTEVACICGVDERAIGKAIKSLTSLDPSLATPKSEKDCRKVCEDKSIDAIYTATPDHWHVLAAIKAARTGKHIMLAKPLGISYPEYRILAKELAANNVRFHYGTQQRTSEHMQLGNNMIREGMIGDIGRVDVWAPGKNDVESPVCNEVPIPSDFDFDRWTGPAPLRPYCPERVTNVGSWFTYNYSIGFLGGWGAHPLDIMVWVLKDKVSGRYTCEGTGELWPSGGLYDTIMSWDVNCKYQNGLEVHFVSEDVAQNSVLNHREIKEDNGTTFYGTKGWISLSRSSVQSNIPEINQKLNNFPKNNGGGINSEKKTMGKVFLDIIKGNSKELCPLDEAIISDTISHMGDTAIRTNRKVTWDPVKGEVVGDTEANKLFIREKRSPYIV